MLAYDYAVIAYYYQRMFNLYPVSKSEVVVQKDIPPPPHSGPLKKNPAESTYTENLRFRFVVLN